VHSANTSDGPIGAEALQAALKKREPKRILVLCRDFVGDIVNSTGALHSIAQRFPNAEITLYIGHRGAPVVENAPFAHRIWIRKRKFIGKAEFVLRMRMARFDLGVILDDSNEKILLVALGGVRLRVGVRKKKYFGLFTASVTWSREKHDLFDPLQGVLNLLGCEPDVSPHLYPSPADVERANQVFAKYHGQAQPCVGLHVGATSMSKQWPPERFAELASKLQTMGVLPLLLCGPNERGLAAAVQEAVPQQPPPIVDDSLTILQFASFLSRLDALVSGDTGPAHLAAAMGVKSVVIFGSTHPHRFYPFGEGHTILYHPTTCDLYAGVCAAKEDDKDACDQRCTRAVSAEEVVAALSELSVLPQVTL
jgi:ADP-heptose:LPS heptosyltransferase